MAYSDEYREMVEDARDALSEMLRASEHDAWGSCRAAYGSLRDALRRDDAERVRVAAKEQEAARPSSDPAWDKHSAQTEHWRKMPREARENLLLDALGDDSLIASEIADRMCRELRTRQGWQRVSMRNGRVLEPLSTEETRRVALRLLASGQLERTVKPRGKLAAVQHFSRKRGLDGPIADLERTYHDRRAA